MKKLLPRSTGAKTDDDDGEEVGPLDVELERSESATDGAGQDASQEGTGDQPNNTSTKSDNQTILHLLGEKEQVGIRWQFLSAVLISIIFL